MLSEKSIKKTKFDYGFFNLIRFLANSYLNLRTRGVFFILMSWNSLSSLNIHKDHFSNDQFFHFKTSVISSGHALSFKNCFSVWGCDSRPNSSSLLDTVDLWAFEGFEGLSRLLLTHSDVSFLSYHSRLCLESFISLCPLLVS